MLSIHEAWLKEREIFEEYKRTNPKLLVLFPSSEKEMLSRIGIKTEFQSRSKGYIRLYPQDFIVEEVSRDGEISEIEPKENKIVPAVFPFTLYTDLVKTEISTSDALNSIAKIIEMKPSKIGCAGLKDVKALTSQKIAFPNINLGIFEKIEKISIPNLFLTNFNFGKGSIHAGEIFGNRFAIFIRAEKEIDEKWLSQKLDRFKKEGFLNFYQIQRFGTPRYLSHFFGRLILQGRYKEIILAFLAMSGLREIPLIKERRKEAEKFFGDWKKMEEIFRKFPYTFRNEIRLLSYLKKNPKNFIGALIFLEDQTTLWVYAYISYLFNLLLSLNGLDLPEEIPLLSGGLKDQKIYDFWLKKDRTENFEKNLSPFKFIRLKRRFVKTRIVPEKIIFKVLPEGIVLSFILEKGVYATTFLMNLFEMKQGLPLPEWVDAKEYDIKKILGIGFIEKAKEVLKINSEQN